MKDWMRQNWRMTFKEDAPAEAAASGGGSSGAEMPPVKTSETSPSGVENPPAKALEKPPAKPAIDEAEFNTIKAERDKYASTMAKIAERVEVDPTTGEVRLKTPGTPTKMTEEERTTKTVQLVQAAQREESIAAEAFKSDPLFSKVFPKAKEFVQRLTPDKQTSVAWQNAYALAAGSKEIIAEREKLAEQRGAERAKAEFIKQGGASVPSGSGDKKGEEFNADNVVLNQVQLDAANKMIKNGMIPDLKTYKKNLWKKEQRERGVAV